MAFEKKEYTFFWFIENYSYSWHDKGEVLVSPEFTPDGLEGTSWILHLYPRGYKEESKSKIALYLARSEHDSGPETFPIKYELSVISADRSPFKSTQGEHTFKKGDGHGNFNFLCMEEVLLRRKAEYLPEDTLIVLSKLWYGEGKIYQAGKYSGRTRIGTEKISFVQRVENFRALKPNEKEILHILSQSKPECVISSSLYFTDKSCCEGKIIVEIASNDRSYILRKLKISLLNRSENSIECGENDNLFDGRRSDIQKLPLSLTRQVILDRNIEYLPNDELTLICECTFSTGVEFEKIEETQHKLPMTASKKNCKIVSYKNVYNTEEKLSACTSASEDMKEVYINQCLTDVELKTKTKAFPAHKIVLCARSSVFKAMLTNDMKEKNTGCIQVDDLENDTVEQLLLFLYSDHIDNLQWDSAIKLYYVGDKYAIEKLKVLCSSFLVDNLSISTASELLLLADTHNDSDLKNFAEDFVLKHKLQIIDSEEWTDFGKINPQLAMRTMYFMIKGKKGGK